MTTNDDLDDMTFNAIIGHYRMAVNKLLNPLRLYGQSIYVDQALKELESLGIQLHFKLSGLDEIPFMLNDLHW